MVLDQNLFFVIFFLVKGVFPVFNVILFSLPFFFLVFNATTLFPCVYARLYVFGSRICE